MEPLDTGLIRVTLNMTERTTDEAYRAKEAAEDYVQQILERYGEDSEEWLQADAFAAAAYALAEGATAAADAVRKATPSTPSRDQVAVPIELPVDSSDVDVVFPKTPSLPHPFVPAPGEGPRKLARGSDEPLG